MHVDSRVYVGLSNPLDATLDAHFYPLDFPPEWRLVFVASRFSCLYFSPQWVDTIENEALDDMIDELSGTSHKVFIAAETAQAQRESLAQKLRDQGLDVEVIPRQQVLEMDACLAPKPLADRLKVHLASEQTRIVLLSHAGLCPAMIEQTRPLIELLGY